MEAVTTEIQYRTLPVEEWDRVEPLFRAEGGTLPDPGASRIFVAERDGAIMAFLVLQIQPHIQPFWIDPEERGRPGMYRVLFSTMADMAQQAIGRDCYVFVDNVVVERMLKSCGLETLKGELLCRRPLPASKSNL